MAAAKRPREEDSVTILVVGSAGTGKSRLVNFVINPDGQGTSPLPSESGSRGVSRVPVCFVNDGSPLQVQAVLHSREEAIRALRSAYFCASEAALVQLVVGTFACASIDDLLQKCADKLAAAVRVPIASMANVAEALKSVNALCMSEKAKASTRTHYIDRTGQLQLRIKLAKEQIGKRCSANFTKEDKRLVTASLTAMEEELLQLKSLQEKALSDLELLPLGEVTKWIEVRGTFPGLPSNTAIVDCPGWGDADNSVANVFAGCSVIISTSIRIGGDEDVKMLMRRMRNHVQGLLPSTSPIFVSYAASSGSDVQLSDEERNGLLQRWKASLYTNTSKGSPRLRAFVDRAYRTADILLNSDKFAGRLQTFVDAAIAEQAYRHQQQQHGPQLKVNPVINTGYVCIADVLHFHTYMLKSTHNANKYHQLPDGTARERTMSVCIMDAMPDLVAAGWALFIDSLCDSVASAASNPNRKYALDSRATPPAVMKEMDAVLQQVYPAFAASLHSQLEPKLLETYALDFVLDDDIEKCNADCEAMMHEFAHEQLKAVCATHKFSVQAPMPVFEESLPEETLVASDLWCSGPSMELTPEEKKAIQAAIRILATEGHKAAASKDKISCLDDVDVTVNKALLPMQLLASNGHIEMGKSVMDLLNEIGAGTASTRINMLAGASGYNKAGEVCIDTYTGAALTIIWLESMADADKALCKAKEEEKKQPFSHKVNDPRVFQRAQPRVFAVVEENCCLQDIVKLMQAICLATSIKSWLHVPAGFCNMTEMISALPIRCQPVFDVRNALRWMQNCFVSAVSPDSRAGVAGRAGHGGSHAITAIFGGIAFSNSFRLNVVSDYTYGLLSAGSSSRMMIAGKFDYVCS